MGRRGRAEFPTPQALARVPKNAASSYPRWRTAVRRHRAERPGAPGFDGLEEGQTTPAPEISDLSISRQPGARLVVLQELLLGYLELLRHLPKLILQLHRAHLREPREFICCIPRRRVHILVVVVDE